MVDPSDLSGKQKAAILMVTLGSEASAEIMKHMEPELLEELTFEIASLGSIPPELKHKVLEEFYQMAQAKDFISFGGVDYARETLNRAVGSDRAAEILTKLESAIKETPFEFVRKADPGQVLSFIQDEHPQTIALVLAHLAPTVAAMVLAALPEELQTDVVYRIANMEQTSPEIIRDVELVLERKLASVIRPEMTKVGGVKNVAELLNRVDRTTEKNILSKLSERDSELSNEVRGLMFVFDDIVMVTDAGVQRTLKEIENKDLALALKAANEDVKKKVFSNMSNRAAEMIKEDMEYMGPVRLRDVEAAQMRIVEVIRRLEDAGEIVIVGRGDEDQLVV
ncbi:MAG: flagellar motor switch protein FliG [Candidatus Abyssobacteria bacterium SURF_17]|jgi:flagellar motor switch protein FliG|uniref:Flagellar motor switch protein FliG n=1 Tax=Candidatus Abyssobacteria bacterium SURF_17 TaxID=2093361 RepID=A0A419F4I4_9BACT|nr:MAG: flagellar motor switch protein FliG [Candidatus Abyssubacteria bacterium SURF_17]